jgi:hypothetical protein
MNPTLVINSVSVHFIEFADDTVKWTVSLLGITFIISKFVLCPLVFQNVINILICSEKRYTVRRRAYGMEEEGKKVGERA